MDAQSLKELTRHTLIRTVNRLGISSKYIGTPKSVVRTAEWTNAHRSSPGVFFEEVYPEKEIKERPPVTLEATVHRMYSDEYNRTQPQAFVAGIAGGRVWGRYGAVITPDDLLIGDISREFGQYGGILNEGHSIFRQVKLSKVRKVEGKVAVVAAAGSQNYHHWLYDTLPRIGLLQKAGLIKEIDHFIIDYSGLRFQKEGLDALGVPAAKVIPCDDHWNFHVQAEELIVTSLPARLGTISRWTVEFLRDIFLSDAGLGEGAGRRGEGAGRRGEGAGRRGEGAGRRDEGAGRRLYLSRRKAPTRTLINEKEILGILGKLNFCPFYAEDHSIRETAAVFAAAESIVGVHGSGFANLAFCSPETKVVDILAPKHLDPYYWILANATGSVYGYIFGEGERLPEDTDLVRNKIDEDIRVNIAEFEKILNKLAISGE
ncbi:MAG TPA: glycosyltransferase family 61 protein [Puia sp.]|nr:glycosyltransferase family 61 protein [Puia sp.]